MGKEYRYHNFTRSILKTSMFRYHLIPILWFPASSGTTMTNKVGFRLKVINLSRPAEIRKQVHVIHPYSMNTVRLTEYSKLGLIRLNYDEFSYRGLKCSNAHRIADESSPSSPLYAIRFCNVSSFRHILAVANEDGTVRIHDTGQIDSTLVNFHAHHNAIFDLVWLEDDVKFVTSSGDHSAILWDLGRAEPTPIVRMVGHQGSVKTVVCKPGSANVFATGARDGSIMQWDIRCRPSHNDSTLNDHFPTVRADKVIRYSHLKNVSNLNRTKTADKLINNPQCVTSIVYQNPEAIISCSSTDKYIKVWDCRKSYSAFKGIPAPLKTIDRGLGSMNRSGYTSLAISPCRLKLYANCTDATVYCFNVGTYSSNPIASYNSSNGSSYFCKINLSPDGKFLSSGSPEEKGYIWSVANTKQHLVTLEGHCAEVTCVDWCKYGRLKLASCSDDGTYRMWETTKTDTEFDPNVTSCGTVHYRSPIKRKFRQYFGSHLKQSLKPEVSQLVGQLPNYVVNGESPHRTPTTKALLESPARECDWLRKLSIQTPPLKTCNRSKRTARRRSSNVRESLLKYFTKPIEASASDVS